MGLRPKARWKQFSLRGLLLLTTAVALLLAWFAWRLQSARNQRDGAEAILRAEGEIAYADQFDGRVSRLTPLPAKGSSWLGGWSERTFGVDVFRAPISVKLFDDASTALVSKYSLTDLQIVRLEGRAANTDEGLKHLGNCRQLRVLSLEDTGITDRGLENIYGCRRLEELWLANTGVTDAALEKIARLSALQVLDIRGTSISDDGLKVVAKMPSLWLLYLDSPALSDVGLKNLQNAPHLQNLWLGEDSSAQFDLAKLAGIPNVSQLYLTGSLITDDRLQPLATNGTIEHLKLQGCTGLTDESLSIVASMPNLKSLGISSSPFSAKAVNEFKAKRPSCKVW
jgi:Leucine-rich repeat (LRR) protein